MGDLRSLCKLKKIRTGSNPTEVKLQELLAEDIRDHPAEEEELPSDREDVRDEEDDLPPPHRTRETRVPRLLSPRIELNGSGSSTGESSTSGNIEGSLNEEDILLARMA
ncbi:hypothetical protein NDU88_000118 [Pleurodeles waltl]|uniref:Uncharacterized protein n=1 Tax=Pleurodeles waltl TaxID=8319 RepID=A0AAV7TG79_PLEWA|nr:hypothetical protein NDU88_000118 [Pleurodeles waltl]